MKASLGKLLRLILVLPTGMAMLAATSSATAEYKTAEPKMDQQASSGTSKAAAPLVGNIQHTHKVKKQKYKPAKARTATAAPLQSGLNDSSLRAQVQSSVGIIGVKFVTTTGRPPVINRIFPGTPAATADLANDDVIVAVDGVPTGRLSKDEIFDLIVGTPGTSVTLTINRHGEFHAVTCTRMDINELTDPRVRRDYLMSM